MKTLTTRMMDLIHKQFRKPLESISPYFRYTQQLYFENAKDQVLDLVVTEGVSPPSCRTASSWPTGSTEGS